VASNSEIEMRWVDAWNKQVLSGCLSNINEEPPSMLIKYFCRPPGTLRSSIVAVPTTGSGGLLSVVPTGTKTNQRRVLQIESK
jgi:hypothetical protein